MSNDQARAREVISTFLQRAGKAKVALSDDMGLYGEGLALDSLEAAELSALLEDELGSDPFSAGAEMPQTIGDIVAFYPATASA